MSMKCYFSNRIYKSKLNEQTLSMMNDTHKLYNSKLHAVYNLQILEKRALANGKKIKGTNYHKWLKETFNLDDYYANSILQESKALLSSQEELKKIYIEQTEKDIKEIKSKISKTKARRTILQKI